MPSMLLIRLAGAVPDVAPRWLLGAARDICAPTEPGGRPGGPPGDTGAQPYPGPLPYPGPEPSPGPPPFSVGAPMPDGPPDGALPGDGATTSWRLGWLDDRSAPPGWPPATARFGSQSREVTGAELTRRSYAQLAQGTPTRRVRVTMTTPTFFSRDGRDLPLPDPALAIQGLLTRWNAFAPGPLRIGAGDARSLVDAVFLDGVWGSSAEVELGHGLRQVGFVGHADLRLMAGTSDFVATMFTALTRFAAFAGVGERTAYGFGAVDVDILDLPVPRRLVSVPTSRRFDGRRAPATPAAPRPPEGRAAPPAPPPGPAGP
ncbi:CRISPR system precrRNA processing endoribonuclease RAMP protein Cas6, partial [Frankia sp. CNm7]|uniref:CRISPR system precrRNA processing endoribonuclease RAMP protein Cas6 n=1 Tax=Frankia nepalensis TaxID=1836974 RepID=UPI001931AB7B